jgi:hypothetical protein
VPVVPVRVMLLLLLRHLLKWCGWCGLLVWLQQLLHGQVYWLECRLLSVAVLVRVLLLLLLQLLVVQLIPSFEQLGGQPF